MVNVPMYDRFFAREVTRVPAGPRSGSPTRAGRRTTPWPSTAPGGRPSGSGPTRRPRSSSTSRGSTASTAPSTPPRTAARAWPPPWSSATSPSTRARRTAGPLQPPVERASGVTRRVPEDHDTIQAAVDAARPGDLVLVGPGSTARRSRSPCRRWSSAAATATEVVVDGGFERPNGISVTADGVAVENLTVRNALVNGLFWTGVRGYRASLCHRIQRRGLRHLRLRLDRRPVRAHSYASGSPTPASTSASAIPATPSSTRWWPSRTPSATRAPTPAAICSSSLRLAAQLGRDRPQHARLRAAAAVPPGRHRRQPGEANHNRDAPGVPLEWAPSATASSLPAATTPGSSATAW